MLLKNYDPERQRLADPAVAFGTGPWERVAFRGGVAIVDCEGRLICELAGHIVNDAQIARRIEALGAPVPARIGGAAISGPAFIERIETLQRQFGISDGELASVLVGMVVAIVREQGEDPLSFMRWANAHYPVPSPPDESAQEQDEEQESLARGERLYSEIQALCTASGLNAAQLIGVLASIFICLCRDNDENPTRFIEIAQQEFVRGLDG